MSDSYIVIRGYRRDRGGGFFYLGRRERHGFFGRKAEVIWGFNTTTTDAAFRFLSTRMALHRVVQLNAVRNFMRSGGIWEIVRITEPEVLASMGDGPLQQLARVAE